MTPMRVRFDRFVIDSETRELLLGGDRVPLSPKAFDLLTILIAERPKALAKSDLLDRLWPGTFVVEKNLANLVGEIRHAIGDDAANPRCPRRKIKVEKDGSWWSLTAHPGSLSR